MVIWGLGVQGVCLLCVCVFFLFPGVFVVFPRGCSRLYVIYYPEGPYTLLLWN